MNQPAPPENSSDASDKGRAPAGGLRAWLQLFRIPNVFTAMADIAAGFVFVRGSLSPAPVFFALLAASSLMYIAGMALNDVYDFAQDLRQRPGRPLPSGRIGRRAASFCGHVLLLTGLSLAWLAGFLQTGPTAAALPWRSGVVASLLAVCIVAYDAILKRTPLGPLAMGGCRFFNLLLGMSVAEQIACGDSPYVLWFQPGQLIIAGGVGLYIAGVTWFARTEARDSSRPQLAAALAVMLAGLALTAAYGSYFTRLAHFAGRDEKTIAMWQMLIVLIGFTIARRAAMAVYEPSPANVQAAVKNAIMSLIVIDAAVCLAVGPWYAVGVMALLAPTLLVGRWIYST